MKLRQATICLLLCNSLSGYGQNVPTPSGLLTNLLSKPELSVLTTAGPKFCWVVPALEKNDYQTAWQVEVASSRQQLEQCEPDMWNSGKTVGNQSINILYKGAPLQSGQSYYWRVKTWSRSGKESAYSGIQKFNIGDITRAKSWPGESRWVQIKAPDGTDLWTFEDRHPITYHPGYPIDSHKRQDGTWFIDFGKAAFANVTLTLDWKPRPSEPKDTLIEVRVGEKSMADSIDAKPGGGVIYQKYPLRLEEGTRKYHIEIPRFKPHYPHSQPLPEHMLEVIPFRYCEVAGRGLDLSLVSAEQMRLHTEFNSYTSSFRSDNKILNDVYDLCRYSIIANTFNGDYAASQRERMMYEADAYIHQMGHYAVDREFATARYSLENMIYHATWPTEWISHTVMMLWQDYLHTGDTDIIRRNYRDIQPKLMIALTMPNGLISTKTGLVTEDFCKSIFYTGKELKDIVDWPHGSMSGALPGGETDDYQFQDYNTVVNAFHYHTLVLMEKMARAIGKTADAAAYAKRSKALYKKFQESFFDTKRGVYTDGIGTDHASLHANLYPLAFGLVPEKAKPGVIAYIETKGMACGVYSANYLLEGLFDAGEGDYAMSLLTSQSDRSWYNMLRVGATMTTEAWDNKYKTNNGWSHAWSSCPAHILPRKLMGIEPMEPGFGCIRIKPQPSGLKFAQAQIPTIRGEVTAAFRATETAFDLTVSYPANVKADIWIPIPKDTNKYRLLLDGKEQKKAKKEGNYLILQSIPSGKHQVHLYGIP